MTIKINMRGKENKSYAGNIGHSQKEQMLLIKS